MLVDYYESEDVFARVPRMAERIDPVVKELDRVLDDDELYQQVRADFGQRYRFTLLHGRKSQPVEVLLCMLILKHLYQWSYQETEEQVDQNLILRWFCRLYWAPVPDDTTLLRWANTLQPETLHALNDRVVQLAAQAKVTKGRKLRLDATCVQTTIHHPTDSGLLVDSVRVLSRFVQRAKALVKDQVRNVQQTCRSRLRAARQLAQTLHRQLRRKAEDKEARALGTLSEADRDHPAYGAAKSASHRGASATDGTAGQASAHPGHRGAATGRARDRPDARARVGGQEDGLGAKSAQSF